MYKLTSIGAYGHPYKKQNSNQALNSRPTIITHPCDCVSFKGQSPVSPSKDDDGIVISGKTINIDNAVVRPTQDSDKNIYMGRKGTININNSEVHREIEICQSSTINVNHSVINKKIDCSQSGAVNITNGSSVNSYVKADMNSTVKVEDSTVGDIFATRGRKVVLTNSRINGELKVPVNRLILQGANTIKDLHLIGSNLYEIDRDSLPPVIDEFVQKLFPNQNKISSRVTYELTRLFERMPDNIPYEYSSNLKEQIVCGKIASAAQKYALLAEFSKHLKQKEDVGKLVEIFCEGYRKEERYPPFISDYRMDRMFNDLYNDVIRAPEARNLFSSDFSCLEFRDIKLSPEQKAIVKDFVAKFHKDCLIKPSEPLELPKGTKITGKITLENGAKLAIGWFDPLRLRIRHI